MDHNTPSRVQECPLPFHHPPRPPSLPRCHLHRHPLRCLLGADGVGADGVDHVGVRGQDWSLCLSTATRNCRFRLTMLSEIIKCVSNFSPLLSSSLLPSYILKPSLAYRKQAFLPSFLELGTSTTMRTHAQSRARRAYTLRG